MPISTSNGNQDQNNNQQQAASSYNDPEFISKVAALYNAANNSQGDSSTTPVSADNQQPTDNAVQTSNANNVNAASNTQPTTNPDDNSVLSAPTDGEQPNNAAPQNPQQSASGVPDNGLILGKFKNVQELANAYQNMEQFNTQTRQELSQNKQTNDQLAQAIEQLKQQIANNQNPQQPQANAPSQEEVNSQFMDKFYSNPIDAIRSILGDAMKPVVDQLNEKLNPVIQGYNNIAMQQKFDNDIRNFATAHPDMKQYKDAMSEILKDPDIANNPKALDIAYGMAKGQNYKNPDEYLSDQNFVNKILGNKEIQGKIIQNYLNGVKQGNQAPQVINSGNNTAGQTPLSPVKRPANLEEAEAMALEMLKK